MNVWLLSIVGVVSLGVLLEILLADGETSKYIKGVFALAVVLVLVSPLPKFLNKDFDMNEFFGEEIITQTAFLDSVATRKNSEREQRVLKELKNANFPVERVRIFYLHRDFDDIDIIKIYVKGTVDELKIAEIVSSKLGCQKEKIKVYIT